ncbi:MAG TPA: TonB-dependent receptor [Gemmatimonadaceae bacterium]|nr:TonB-dependent receptor [Gemmatimonadaceae bacterium]
MPLLLLTLVLLLSYPAYALPAQVTRDSAGTVRVRVLSGNSLPVDGALVRAGRLGSQTDSSGRARLDLPAGSHRIVVSRLGFAPDSVLVQLRVGADTALGFVLREVTGALEGVVVSATRSERRIEDDPVRVEMLDLEEVEEKLMMTPGDITMMLNETSGLRVQTTSPSLGGANVRVQGLRGRYTQILADGLPIFGAQTGGLGLLQIPPMDLGGVEVIKGVASALYGGAALGGVINLVSRRPDETPVRELLVNQTTLGGTDLVGFAGAPLRDPAWGYTVLAGAHRQSQTDRDGDGWTDLPGYERGVVRPRLFWRSARGDQAMLTAGATVERREGGTFDGHVAPDGAAFPERLRTHRFDAGGTLRTLRGAAGILSLRGSLTAQRHAHTFGQVRERDRHLTAFSEIAYTLQEGPRTWVAGAAFLHESYDARDVSGFDFSHQAPGLFAQTTVNAGERVAMTLSGRIDRHDEYGTQASPRASVLVRLPAGWTIRGSAGSGYFAPTPFTEETEVLGLAALRPLPELRAERARGGSVDLGGVVGAVELNATVFASEVRHPIGVREALSGTAGLEMDNVPAPSRASGGELLARWTLEPLRVTATYTYVHATEADPATLVRRAAPLTPRHQAGMVASWEREAEFRSGLEVYYTGRQTLLDNPYRASSRPYWYIGALVEKRFGAARIFLNAENLLDVRQTKHEPLARPAPGPGGRWTNDVWAPLDGRVANLGVRWSLGGTQ